ncbi:MAG: hypothetical protein EA370_03475 [Wenzhouxiangella sp.]|nr:MAG: hypothetical protein EA370_03475 [Wenzhouxiangella sp.]
MRKLITLVLTAALLPGLLAAETGRSGPSPAELAASSEVVVLARLDRANYDKRRGFPVRGSAWVRVLVAYKVPHPMDLIRIFEEGLGEDRCYFDDAPLWQESPRYILFLNHKEQRSYEGNRATCRLDVLVTRDNRYAVRWPQAGLYLSDDELDLVQELEFHGPGATLDASEMTSIRREETMASYFMVEDGEDRSKARLRYTRGILLEDFRTLLGSENLTSDRIQRGR